MHSIKEVPGKDAIREAQADWDVWLCSIKRSFEAQYFIFIGVLSSEVSDTLQGTSKG